MRDSNLKYTSSRANLTCFGETPSFGASAAPFGRHQLAREQARNLLIALLVVAFAMVFAIAGAVRIGDEMAGHSLIDYCHKDRVGGCFLVIR